MDGARFDDGRILIVDRAAADLAVFDSAGHFIQTVGRQGTGPGEFQAPLWVGRCGGDSMFVYDRTLGRITVVGPTATAVRDLILPDRAAFVECAPNGRLVMIRLPMSSVTSLRGDVPPMMSQVLVTNLAGDSLAGMGVLKLGETRPLGLMSQMAVAGDLVYYGTADSGYADLYDLQGHREGTLQVAGTRHPPTPADYDRAIERMVVPFPSMQARKEAAKAMHTVPMPDRLPAYQALLADPIGAVWAVTSGPGDSVTTIRGTTPQGRALGELRLPDRFTPFEIGRDYILGVAQTADGEQHVREYRVRRE